MNNRLEENTAKRVPGQRRRSPRKVVQPATDDVVTLRLDARTLVKTKKGYALQKWMEQYPNAVVV